MAHVFAFYDTYMSLKCVCGGGGGGADSSIQQILTI